MPRSKLLKILSIVCLAAMLPVRAQTQQAKELPDPGKISMKVTQIILEPLSAEPFVLRAETNIDIRPEFSLHDAEQALKLQPGNARAQWLRSRGLTALGQHEQAVAALRDLQAELSRYSDKADIDPARLQQLEERLNLIHSLKRKYGASAAEVIAFGAEAARKLHSLEQREAELGRINAELQKLEAELWRAAQALSAKRRKVIPQLSKAASKQLEDLGFKQSRLDISLAAPTQAECAEQGTRITQHGFDTVEFQFAPNPGEAAANAGDHGIPAEQAAPAGIPMGAGAGAPPPAGA